MAYSYHRCVKHHDDNCPEKLKTLEDVFWKFTPYCYDSEGHAKWHAATCNECKRSSVHFICSKEDDVYKAMSNPSLRKVERIECFENINSLASLDAQEIK